MSKLPPPIESTREENEVHFGTEKVIKLTEQSTIAIIMRYK